MADFLDTLISSAFDSLDQGYYDYRPDLLPAGEGRRNLSQIVLASPYPPLIAEVKFASPSAGVIRHEGGEDDESVKIAQSMVRGGASALSILTEPKHFNGSLERFIEIRRNLRVPLLMKDVIVDRRQLDAAAGIGADLVLLISPVFRERRVDEDLHGMIEYAHRNQLEVLLETLTPEEFLEAQETDADMIGINNRDLKTLVTDISTTERIMCAVREKVPAGMKPVVSESGIRGEEELRRVLVGGVKAVLVGSSIMAEVDVEAKVRGLVEGIRSLSLAAPGRMRSSG